MKKGILFLTSGTFGLTNNVPWNGKYRSGGRKEIRCQFYRRTTGKWRVGTPQIAFTLR